MKKRQFRQILKKYSKGKASGEEKALVEGWYNYHAGLERSSLPDIEAIDHDLQEVWERILVGEQVPVKKIRHFKIALVASSVALFFLVFGLALYFIGDRADVPLKRTVSYRPLYLLHDAGQQIGQYDAYVQLESGGRINLDSMQSGQGLSYEKINFSKEEDGTIVYKSDLNKWEELMANRVVHTMHVPKARQSKLVLSDGTIVWLNSESSISFPEVFSWDERKVEISGEVYFEVAHDKKKPFYVQANGVTVKVLGTSFNISAYPDESISSTTLVSGSVEVYVPSESGAIDAQTHSILRPGQQWRLDTENKQVQVNTIEVADIIGWKDGLIVFTNLDLKSIMKKASRWYDIEVAYKSYDPNRRFTGGISSSTTLDEFVKIMSLYQVKIERQGGKLIVVGN